MIRLSTIFLGALLFTAAAGRYNAETAVRELDKKINELEAQRKAELREVQILRAELALLESPDRLAELARAHTDLVPASGSQMMTADDFLVAFGPPASIAPTTSPVPYGNSGGNVVVGAIDTVQGEKVDGGPAATESRQVRRAPERVARIERDLD